MSAKRAATKKKASTGSRKKVVKKVTPKSAASRRGKAARKSPRKPSSKKTVKSAKVKSAKKSAKKTVKSAKSPSRKKVSKKKLSAAKSHKKATGKTKIATVSKKAGAKPAAPARSASKPAAATAKRRNGSVLSGPVRGFTPYQPKRGEDYMSKDQLEHFRQILLAWKRELMEEVDRTMLHMKDDAANFPDPNDRATQESEFGLELRTRDRERKLLKKIDSALARIDDGSYGYCEETGDEIGLRRLEARPVATLCVEAQERRELAERQFRDREDQYR
jgi:DnaK suppressor protein